MKLFSFKHLIIGLCMFAAAGMALALKPTHKIADTGPKIDLEVLILGDAPDAFLRLFADQRAVAEGARNSRLGNTCQACDISNSLGGFRVHFCILFYATGCII